ncbi:MAG: hypothetical protein RLY20_1438 [Verrucomicrobiota bacterium]|jgi:dipeptidyl aminopeptidase/acylaminoacyl peptidase
MKTKLVLLSVVLAVGSFGCGRAPDLTEGGKKTLAGARQSFSTKLVRREKTNERVPFPPPNQLCLVMYPSSVGMLSAYISAPPRDTQKHPAIIWIFGGFDNSISETAWQPGSPENDQSAGAFREAGIITLYPSLSGGNMNPGFREGLYGEASDVIAAAVYLQHQPGVDPERIYLGGHSTGGTLALLVAEHTNLFRAVFAFGPVANIRGYGPDNLPFNLNDHEEVALRSPINWLNAIHTPTFVLEGSLPDSNIGELRKLARASQNPLLHFHPVKGADHFSVLHPITRLLAKKILADEGATPNLSFTDAEFGQAMKSD